MPLFSVKTLFLLNISKCVEVIIGCTNTHWKSTLQLFPLSMCLVCNSHMQLVLHMTAAVHLMTDASSTTHSHLCSLSHL